MKLFNYFQLKSIFNLVLFVFAVQVITACGSDNSSAGGPTGLQKQDPNKPLTPGQKNELQNFSAGRVFIKDATHKLIYKDHLKPLAEEGIEILFSKLIEYAKSTLDSNSGSSVGSNSGSTIGSNQGSTIGSNQGSTIDSGDLLDSCQKVITPPTEREELGSAGGKFGHVNTSFKTLSLTFNGQGCPVDLSVQVVGKRKPGGFDAVTTFSFEAKDEKVTSLVDVVRVKINVKTVMEIKKLSGGDTIMIFNSTTTGQGLSKSRGEFVEEHEESNTVTISGTESLAENGKMNLFTSARRYVSFTDYALELKSAITVKDSLNSTPILTFFANGESISEFEYQEYQKIMEPATVALKENEEVREGGHRCSLKIYDMFNKEQLKKYIDKGQEAPLPVAELLTCNQNKKKAFQFQNGLVEYEVRFQPDHIVGMLSNGKGTNTLAFSNKTEKFDDAEDFMNLGFRLKCEIVESCQ